MIEIEYVMSPFKSIMVSIGHMIESMDIGFSAKHYNKRIISNGMDEILHFLQKHGEKNSINCVNDSKKVVKKYNL